MEQTKELAELRNEVALLKNMLSGATAQLSNATNLSVETTTPSFSNIVNSNLTSQPSRSSQPATSEKQLHPASSAPANDCKFNVVIYGLAECTKGTRKHVRQTHDFELVTTTISPLDEHISRHSVCDCIRLGQYNESRKWPILVKLNSAHEVSIVLANRPKLDKGISIKPDMAKQEREIKSLLLKEWRSLITSGKQSKEIKIRGRPLYVSNALYGHVDYVD